MREFKSFTPDLYALADWLSQSIAMESTGVYWIPIYELLEESGKRLSGKTKCSNNRASTLYRSNPALGAYLRRLKSRNGPAKAITATAHKLAKIIYNMLCHVMSWR